MKKTTETGRCRWQNNAKTTPKQPQKRKRLYKMLRKFAAFVFMLVNISLLLTTTVSAYIDPATTAMLTQIIAGVFITLGVVFGVFRRKIVLFFKNKSVNRAARKIERQSKKQNERENNS
jgi:uncharacterized membrane protein